MPKQDISILCSDDVVLQGTLFSPEKKPKGAIMVGPATGIKRQFYTHFAGYLAEQGFGVITFDNRGIGDSLDGSIVDSEADLVQWGRYDMFAVLEKLKELVPDVPYYLVGHSAGGQLIGLMENYSDLQAIFNVAASSGSLRNISGGFWWKARFFMSILIPLTNGLIGYTPSQWIGMGDPLPKGVARQWAEWCNGSCYVKMAFGKEIQTHWFDEIEAPIKWLFATDDPIANQQNVEEMSSVFPNAKSELLKLVPSKQGLKEIGHMKFFSRSSKTLWCLIPEFFV